MERAGERSRGRARSWSALGAVAVALVAAAAVVRCGGSEKTVQVPPGDDAGYPPRGLDASVPDAGGDAGTSDAGAPDGGADAGEPDAGTQDAGAPDPGNPDAGNPDAGNPDAGNPDAGAPDAGPPPPPPLLPPTLGQPSRAEIQIVPATNLIGASADEGGFVWAVDSGPSDTRLPPEKRGALYLLRPGATSFERYPIGTAGVGTSAQNAGLRSVAGGGPGECWVGYDGLFQNGESDDPSVPIGIRQSGGADHFFATPNGIQLDRHVMFWTPPGVLAAEPAGRWKVRSIYAIVYNRGRTGLPGDVFFGGTHGTAVVHPDGTMEEHLHAGFNYCPTPSPDSCSLVAGDHHGVAIHQPTGNFWIGADFASSFADYRRAGNVMGRVHINDNSDTPSPTAFRTWVGKSVDDQRPEFGGRDFVQAMTFDAYGDLWIGSYYNGMAHVKIDQQTGLALVHSQSDIEYWNHRFGKTPAWQADPTGGTIRDYVWSLAGDPDGSIWMGGPHGAWRFVAATNQWVFYGALLPGSNVAQVSLDPRPGHHVAYFATDGGLAIYRGP
jgi:hypothetical protein